MATMMHSNLFAAYLEGGVVISKKLSSILNKANGMRSSGNDIFRIGMNSVINCSF